MIDFLNGRACYYVTCPAARGRKIFLDAADYNRFFQLIRRCKDKVPAHLYAYCLIPDAVYLILQPVSADGLDAFMQEIRHRYETYYQARHGLAGTVWQRPYKRDFINSDTALFACIKYIEFIPVQSQNCISPTRYPYSSCCQRINESGDGILDLHAFLLEKH